MTMMVMTKVGTKMHSYPYYNFGAVRIKIFSFLQDYWSPSLLFCTLSHFLYSDLISLFLTSFLSPSPTRDKLQMTWIPLLIIFFVSSAVTFPATSHSNLRDKMIGEETEQCDKVEKKKKRKYLSYSRGGFIPLMDLTPYKNEENTHSNIRKSKYTGKEIESNSRLVVFLFLYFDLWITRTV